MANQYPVTWDLASFFEGGSSSPALAARLDELTADLAALRAQLEALPEPETAEALDQWHKVIDLMQHLLDRFSHTGSFVYCLMAQDVKDTTAKLQMGRLQQMAAELQGIDILVKQRVLNLPEATWQKLLAAPRFQPLVFPLTELRTRAAEQMAPDLERLHADLAVDGYHAWDRLYDTIVGRVVVDYKGEQLSVGQAYNKFSDPDPANRVELFARWEEAWGKEAELIAAALNHLAGYRLNLYKHRGWDSVLKEPLHENRMTEATLKAMWGAVEAGKGQLAKFMQRKAKLLGQEKLHWYDEHASVSTTDRKVTYDEAARFIIENFGQFSPKMAEFARHAIEHGWIEAEDRPGKMPGGYCTGFPEAKESRIFMTFGGEPMGISTLAHELGHAYHSHVMWDLPPMARQYAMNVAETASTFAELITTKAAIAQAPTREERLALLDDSIKRAGAMFMNIHARFLFETRFYEARKQGLLSVDQLNALMEQAQKDAFQDGLATYHPLFWASKGHFYATGAPFYNFPYTFGFLFSAGIYAQALKEGPAFEQRYVALLRDTGNMTTEELARRHLGVDLTQPDFWTAAVNTVLADVTEFLALTEQA